MGGGGEVAQMRRIFCAGAQSVKGRFIFISGGEGVVCAGCGGGGGGDAHGFFERVGRGEQVMQIDADL